MAKSIFAIFFKVINVCRFCACVKLVLIDFFILLVKMRFFAVLQGSSIEESETARVNLV